MDNSDYQIHVPQKQLEQITNKIASLERESQVLVLKQEAAVKELTKQSARLKIFQTELETLHGELLLLQQGSEVATTSDDLSTLNEGTEEFKQVLKQYSVSQLGQDIWVLEQTNYKKSGFFVEFGATDGVSLSNTWLLEKKFAWQGICAEPNPKLYSQLIANRDCCISNDCVGAQTGEKVDFILADAYGGMLKHAELDNHADKRNAYAEFENNKVELETISLHDFLVKNNAPKEITYLSIDTEGSEFEILQNFPFEEWDIQYLTIEHNFTEQRERIHALLSRYGYVRKEVEWDDWYYKEGYEINSERKQLLENETTQACLSHLQMLRDALAKYYTDHQTYPVSLGFDGLRSTWGERSEEWIKGLVPIYLDALPDIPNFEANSKKQYLYNSNGKDYKLILHDDKIDEYIVQNLNSLIDPARKNAAYGYWTADAELW